MIKFTDYIDVRAFFIAFGIGLLIVYINYKPRKIIIQWPTPENVNKLIYKDKDETCYKYKAQEVSCPSDKSLIIK
jgi:hypothetical protein